MSDLNEDRCSYRGANRTTFHLEKICTRHESYYLVCMTQKVYDVAARPNKFRLTTNFLGGPSAIESGKVLGNGPDDI